MLFVISTYYLIMVCFLKKKKFLMHMVPELNESLVVTNKMWLLENNNYHHISAVFFPLTLTTLHKIVRMVRKITTLLQTLSFIYYKEI